MTQSKTQEPTDEPTEESTDEKRIVVDDPEDYQKTKKLELIYQTKKQVVTLRNNRRKRLDYYNRNVAGNANKEYNKKLASTVAQYGGELLPLIEEAYDNDVLADDHLVAQVSSEHPKMDVIKFIQMDGNIQHPHKQWDSPPKAVSLAFYHQLNRILRKLGLGLELEEDLGPADI